MHLDNIFQSIVLIFLKSHNYIHLDLLNIFNIIFTDFWYDFAPFRGSYDLDYVIFLQKIPKKICFIWSEMKLFVRFLRIYTQYFSLIWKNLKVGWQFLGY